MSLTALNEESDMMTTFIYGGATLYYSPQFQSQLEKLQKHIGGKVKLSDGRIGVLKSIDGVAGRKDGLRVPNTTVILENGKETYPGVDELEIYAEEEEEIRDDLWEKYGIMFKKVYGVGRRGSGAKTHLIELWEIITVDEKRQYKKGSAQEMFLKERKKSSPKKVYSHTWTMCNTNGSFHCTSFNATAPVKEVTCKKCRKIAKNMGLV